MGMTELEHIGQLAVALYAARRELEEAEIVGPIPNNRLRGTFTERERTLAAAIEHYDKLYA